jgi:hypothetical protein
MAVFRVLLNLLVILVLPLAGGLPEALAFSLAQLFLEEHLATLLLFLLQPLLALTVGFAETKLLAFDTLPAFNELAFEHLPAKPRVLPLLGLTGLALLAPGALLREPPLAGFALFTLALILALQFLALAGHPKLQLHLLRIEARLGLLACLAKPKLRLLAFAQSLAF